MKEKYTIIIKNDACSPEKSAKIWLFLIGIYFFVYTAILKQVLVANVHGAADAFVNKGDGKTGLYPYGYGLTY